MDSNSNTILKSVYYDHKNPASFFSVINLYKEVKKYDPNITLNYVKDWLSGEFVYTLHKQVRKNFERNPIVVNNIDKQWEADLVDMQMFANKNNGYRYILTVIDVFSKYSWAKAIKTKNGISIVNAFKNILKDNRKPIFIRTDKGTEFLNNTVQKFFSSNSIKHFTSNDSKIKCAVVERFNRTLKSKMFKYFTSKGTRKYIDILKDLVNSINNSYHRSIKMRPIDVNENNKNIVFKNLYLKPTKSTTKNKITQSSLVRKQYNFNPFDKGYYPNWTDQIYEIDKIHIDRNKPFIKIKDDSSQRFYPEQLQIVKPNLYRVEKIIRTKGKSPNIKYFVKWLGYDHNYNSWINESDLVKL
jgi:integrase-like protein/chromodomain-containing protein